MARPSEGAVFVYELEGDLESPDFQREHAAESQGLLCARVSKLTVHLLPSARSSVQVAGKSYFLGIYALAPEGWRMIPYLPWSGSAKEKKDSAEGRMW